MKNQDKYTVGCPQCGKLTPIGTLCESCGYVVPGNKPKDDSDSEEKPHGNQYVGMYIWHKYPRETPNTGGWFLVTLENPKNDFRWVSRAFWSDMSQEFVLTGFFDCQPTVKAFALQPMAYAG